MRESEKDRDEGASAVMISLIYYNAQPLRYMQIYSGAFKASPSKHLFLSQRDRGDIV